MNPVAMAGFCLLVCGELGAQVRLDRPSPGIRSLGFAIGSFSAKVACSPASAPALCPTASRSGVDVTGFYAVDLSKRVSLSSSIVWRRVRWSGARLDQVFVPLEARFWPSAGLFVGAGLGAFNLIKVVPDGGDAEYGGMWGGYLDCGLQLRVPASDRHAVRVVVSLQVGTNDQRSLFSTSASNALIQIPHLRYRTLSLNLSAAWSSRR